MKRASWVVAFAVTILGVPTHAKNPAAEFDVREFTCPIGGKSFRQDVGYPGFPLITLPDGSWLGDTEIGAQIPVCPDNGLVMIPELKASEDSGSNSLSYTDYTAEERAQLPGLIANTDYIALKADGPYAQAWWLATKLNRPAEDRFFMLQRSTWATRDPAKRKKLVARFASEGPAIIAAFDGDRAKRHISSLYIVNAFRELGEFDAALMLLDRLDAEAIAGPVPSQSGGELWSPDDAASMRLAIAQKDDGRFAAELLPKRVFQDICEGRMAAFYGPTTSATRAACDIRSEREMLEAADEQRAIALRGDDKALAARCAAQPATGQDRAVELACEYRQRDLDDQAGERMITDGPSLAAACNSTAPTARNGPLRSACTTFDVATGMALGTQLADDAGAFALFCPGERTAEVPDRSEIATSACEVAVRLLDERQEAALVADPSRLDTLCADKDDQGYVRSRRDIDYGTLLGACSTLQSNRQAAKVEQLATVPTEFDVHCGRFSRTNVAGNDVADLSNEQEQCRDAWRLRENRRVRAEAEARGLACFHDVIYSPTRPRCVSKSAYAAEMAKGSSPLQSKWDENSSLMQAARAQATHIIVEAKAQRTYPKRHKGDLR